ncbi:ADP-ribosylglycohydrolase family protein [Myxococcus sp. AM011]|uniref:ADP-ribosylglycohydrolase family protein n=1 Tax=Myxococcus sp. AM011 TaxID=2745200 RepID=UPI001595AA2C|nr:ADP-ribosylglycohydrolase family protein [Myxococcus sp. AM011]NVJ24684.1 ADP-ribosylglycohydrolase family protein [Myxococcus sp. AM011]
MSSTGRPADHAERMSRALLSLEGLSVGDGFGERFFAARSLVAEWVEARRPPSAPWPYTDDTEMALSVVQVLDEHGQVEQERLARLFGTRYRANRYRGYGGTALDILERIHLGMHWLPASSQVFDGTGSKGNGAAMRVAPLGAYFAGDLRRAADEARLSAEVTHYHPDGQAGAMAVAVAAAWACQDAATRGPARNLFDVVLEYTPNGATRRGLEKARGWSLETTPTAAAKELGSGFRVLSEDTVPFVVWCAVRHMEHYEDALWSTVSGRGDMDTTCAMVGGIVVLVTGRAAIPASWLEAREMLQLRALE